MVLSELHKGEHAEIVRLNADKVLRDRFASFGVLPGEYVVVQECSLAKQTIEINVDGTIVALRKQEADKIIVERTEPQSSTE
jgi:ferrous iron transport protein A